MTVKILYWSFLFIVFYCFIGYTLVLALLVCVKKVFYPTSAPENCMLEYPNVCLLVAAYNEAGCIQEKITNTLQLDYPNEKIQYLWITDGSNDGTEKILSGYPSFQVLHLPERKGKAAAINRAMPFVKTPFTIFSDANSMLSTNCIKEILQPFKSPQIACVAGEKAIYSSTKDNAPSSSESFYWNYESGLKKLDSQLNSAIGAAGEIFGIRSKLFVPLPEDTIIEDFVMSINLIRQGYKIDYAPKAKAVETGSLTVEEEMKRKIRIASGGFQVLSRYPDLLNPIKYGWFSFQFFSHKFLRWAVLPWAFFALLPLNIALCSENGFFYSLGLAFQVGFYLVAGIGFLLQKRAIGIKYIFYPFYFLRTLMATFQGFIRFLKNEQPVTWEKAKRK
jgi:cellulose synthase/poly-beta-1,6-N-acetylglucosamine synthase-like glycosyltransferase